MAKMTADPKTQDPGMVSGDDADAKAPGNRRPGRVVGQYGTGFHCD